MSEKQDTSLHQRREDPFIILINSAVFESAMTAMRRLERRSSSTEGRLYVNRKSLINVQRGTVIPTEDFINEIVSRLKKAHQNDIANKVHTLGAAYRDKYSELNAPDLDSIDAEPVPLAASAEPQVIDPISQALPEATDYPTFMKDILENLTVVRNGANYEIKPKSGIHDKTPKQIDLCRATDMLSPTIRTVLTGPNDSQAPRAKDILRSQVINFLSYLPIDEQKKERALVLFDEMRTIQHVPAALTPKKKLPIVSNGEVSEYQAFMQSLLSRWVPVFDINNKTYCVGIKRREEGSPDIRLRHNDISKLIKMETQGSNIAKILNGERINCTEEKFNKIFEAILKLVEANKEEKAKAKDLYREQLASQQSTGIGVG